MKNKADNIAKHYLGLPNQQRSQTPLIDWGGRLQNNKQEARPTTQLSIHRSAINVKK